MVIVMNKKVIIGLIAFVVLCSTGCNRQVIDTNYKYKNAVCNYDDIKLYLKVKSWKDYDGEQIQITTDDGVVYLVSTNKCFLKG